MSGGRVDALGLDDGAIFRSLFAAYPDALLVVDLGGSIRLANPAACELLGYAPEQLEGLPVDVLVPDAIRPRHAAYRAAYAAHPRARPMGTQMDLVAKRRDGSEVLVEIALSPLQDHGLPYVVAAIRSVSEYPRVRQALKRARFAECLAQFGRLAVDARDLDVLLGQVVGMVTEALQIDMVQVRLLEPDGIQVRIAAAVGQVAREPVGHVIDIVPGFAADRVLREGRPVLIDTGSEELALAIPRRYLDAGVTCELLVPLTDRGRTIGMICAFGSGEARFSEDETRFLESISSMVATVLQRSSSEDALKHAQRLETVGQLTGGIAHDFNNLLTVISGNLQILNESPATSAEAAAPIIGAALRATQRGAELTAKLLAFSRRQVLQPEVLDVGALLQSLAGMLRRAIDPRVVIQLRVAPGMHCLADPVQLESSLLNVAINARDAMPTGGTLTFECQEAGGADLPPELGANPDPQGYVAISMIDTGAGMTQAVCDRAFEPFFTTKESGRGTGLGLSTVYGFARQSRGAVRLQSVPGSGTRLVLYLPRVRPQVPAAPEAAAHAAGGVRAGVRVLLVEDDPEVMAVGRGLLSSLQCEVRACASAQEALRLLEREPFDLLLSDVLLGAGMRGDELAAQVLRQRPGLPVLLVSGYSGELAADAKGCPVLHKPYTRAQLEAAIARALATTR